MNIFKQSVFISNIIAFLVLIIAGAHIYAQCNYTYTLQTSGITTQLNSVKAVNDMVGWAAGNGAAVRRTVNGGTTWTNANPNTGVINGDIYCIDAIDSSTAICTTTPGSTTFIYRTTDRGTTWTQVYSQTGGFIDGIQMVNTALGFALGDPVGGTWTLLTTANGGMTWVPVLTAPPQVGGEAGWNNAFQVMANNMWFGTSNTKIYHSGNLGATWNSGVTNGLTNSDALHFNTATVGLTGGTILEKTTDGGTGFLTVTAPGSGTIFGIDGNNDSTYFFVRGTGLYISTNNGSSFSTAYTAVSGSFTHIDLSVVNTCASGWAVMNNGAIIRIQGVPNAIEPINNQIPSVYKLEQNYPNPFNPTTQIAFSIPSAGNTKLTLYDVLGNEISVVVNEYKKPGNYSAEFDATNLGSGTYFYKLESGSFVATKKMVLIK